MLEQDTQQQESAQMLAEKHNGRRLDVFDRVGIPKGWVVNGKLDNEAWENIRTYAIPITPGGSNPFKRREAQQKLSGIREKYGQDATFLVIPDDETLEGWSARPVLPGDLTKEPDAVLQEAFDALGDDMFLADMKRHAYMTITGHIDTK